MKRIAVFGASFAATLALGIGIASAQQSTVSGVPGRLRVQAIGVNAATPATGNVTASGTITGATINGTAAVQVNGVNVCTPGGGCIATPTTVSKASTTSRASTVAITADPELQIAPGVGTWLIEFCFFYNGTTTGTQGIRIAFNRTTAGSNAFQWWGGYNGTPTIKAAFQEATVGSPGGSNSRVDISDMAVSGSQSFMCGFGRLIASAGVTYAVEWAQNVSNANNTNMVAGSYLRYRAF